MQGCAEVIKLLNSLGLESPLYPSSPRRIVSCKLLRRRRRATTTQVAFARTMRCRARSNVCEDAARSKPAPPATDQSWIVQYKTSQGKDTIASLRPCRSSKRSKRNVDQRQRRKERRRPIHAIGYFPEFEKYAEGRIIKDQADKKQAT